MVPNGFILHLYGLVGEPLFSVQEKAVLIIILLLEETPCIKKNLKVDSHYILVTFSRHSSKIAMIGKIMERVLFLIHPLYSLLSGNSKYKMA